MSLRVSRSTRRRARPSALCGFGDPVREFAVGQLRGLGEHRDAFAVAAQMLDERVHVSTTPDAHHLDAHLRVDRWGFEAVLTHDDRVDVTGGIDRQQDVVAEKLDGQHCSDAVRLATVRNHRRDKLFGPQQQRAGPSPARTATRPSAQSATPDVTTQGSAMQSPRNSAVKRSLGCR